MIGPVYSIFKEEYAGLRLSILDSEGLNLG